MNRTHWAVKDVNLAKELHAARRITLPSWTGQATKTVDITRHHFDVALSFPGEVRPIVEQVARELKGRIGPNSSTTATTCRNWHGRRSTRCCRRSTGIVRS
jgi:hypothetical protein